MWLGWLGKMVLRRRLHCKTVAFPNISTGVYGYPKQEATEIAVKTVTDFLSEHQEIEKVVFCCFDEENYRIMLEFCL